MPSESIPYLPDDDAHQKSQFWRDESLFSMSPRSEFGHGSRTNSSSSSSVTSEGNGSCQTILKGYQDFNGHKKLNRSQSEPRRYRHNNGNAASKYKTELCHTFSESGGGCKYGEKCQYAHGYQELRDVPRHPKYKTEMCKTFHTEGICPYGHRCHFIHCTPLIIETNTNAYYNWYANNSVLSAYSSAKDLTMSPVMCSSPASSGFSSFDGSMSPLFDSFSSVGSPPPSPIETRLPIFNEISSAPPLPFGGLTA